MRVQDIYNKWDVQTTERVAEILATRHTDRANEFWVSHDNAGYPAIAVLVRDELACLHYFPKEKHAGFQSVAPAEPKPLAGTTKFYASGEVIWLPNDSVVSLMQATLAVQQFFLKAELPEACEWFEL